jgi:hydrogenase expression/formation protein HypC
MCIGFPGRVVAIDPVSALVETEGRRRSASLLLVPDVAVGDWVIVGAGTILERLDPTEAARIQGELGTAITQLEARTRTEGGPSS